MRLDSVSSGVQKDPHRILIYGVGGIGKSTFASEAPSPIFLDTQDGTGHLAVKRFPRPNTWEDVLDSINELIEQDHSYKTFAIDLLDDLEALIWAHICKRDGHSNIEDYGYGKGYKVALNEWRLLLARLEQVRREKKMSIIFTAHAQVKAYKSPLTEDYDRYSLQIHEAASGLLRGWCDTVLFAQHEVVLKVDPKKKRTRGISTGTRLIQTVETAGYHAKNRDNLPDTLPLDYAAFAQAVEEGQPATPESIRSEIAELAAKVTDDVRAKVEHNVKAAGEDASRLVRVLNRLREIQPQQQAQGEAQ
jgi:hypothetical protein